MFAKLTDSNHHVSLHNIAMKSENLIRHMHTHSHMYFHSLQVLFYSLPLVLDGCKREREEGGEVLEEGGEDEIVEQAVDFLQALLNLMTDLQLHLEVRLTPCMYMT